MANRYGRLSELRLRAEVRDGATIIADQFATMPFKVMRPFAVSRDVLPGFSSDTASARAQGSTADACEKGVLAWDTMPSREVAPAQEVVPAQVMVMSVSAGIMAGDEQRIDVKVGPDAVLQMTTQSFEKIHRMEEGAHAERATRLRVASGAYLDYSPLPQIPFAGSAFTSETTIELADKTARLVYGEILSAGRVARGERFAYRWYRNHVRVSVAGRPIFLDNTFYESTGAAGELASGGFGAGVPAGVAPLAMDMEGFGLYEGYTHLANLVLVNLGISDETFTAVRGYLREVTGTIGASAMPAPATGVSTGDDEVAGGITRLASGDCVVKLLGRRAQRLQDVLEHVRALL